MVNYELGISHGVLYPENGAGVVWNGLTSIDELLDGGEKTSIYLDGIKRLDLIGSRNYQAILRAFSNPYEFEVCVGNVSPKKGFMLTKQPPKPFNLSYRTNFGSEGYKIHLIYNALAWPSRSGHITDSKTNTPSISEWKINATPPMSPGFKPSAHLIVDSTRVNPSILQDLEMKLYGRGSDYPKMPSQSELLNIFNNFITEPLSEPL